MAVFIPVLCPDCHSDKVKKHGFSPDGKQRYRCENSECPRRTFILNHAHRASNQRSQTKNHRDVSEWKWN